MGLASVAVSMLSVCLFSIIGSSYGASAEEGEVLHTQTRLS